MRITDFTIIDQGLSFGQIAPPELWLWIRHWAAQPLFSVYLVHIYLGEALLAWEEKKDIFVGYFLWELDIMLQILSAHVLAYVGTFHWLLHWSGMSY